MHACITCKITVATQYTYRLWSFKDATKMVSFLLLAGEKKTPFLVHLKQMFDPSYYVGALDSPKGQLISE